MNKSPEPTEADIARAAVATAKEVYDGSDGRLTVAYYRRLQSFGPVGLVAMNLFRAHKTSSRAKVYRGRRFRAASYDVKNYSLEQLVVALQSAALSWGWQHDPATVNFEWVLYVDLPTGQCSLHSHTRLAGPDYLGRWDGQRLSGERILAFCDELTSIRPPGGLIGTAEQQKFVLDTIH